MFEQRKPEENLTLFPSPFFQGLFLLLIVILCRWVCVNECRYLKRDPSELELQIVVNHLMWVLTELGASGSASSTLNN